MAENMNVLPHDLLAEQAVLGSIFLDPDKIHIASEYLTKDSFSSYLMGCSSTLCRICQTKEIQLIQCLSNLL